MALPFQFTSRLLNNFTIIVPTYKLLKNNNKSPTPDYRVARLTNVPLKPPPTVAWS